ncbi:MAG: hypothetical protein IJL28_08555 [Prevotella sp.]|nr:hypothetical protein [Prevotella sp.]
MAAQNKRKSRGPVPIYADAVKLQFRLMDMLTADIAKKYRFTVVEELFKRSTRLLEDVDMMNMLRGAERQRATLTVAAQVRTIQTTVGNLARCRAITVSQEADLALLVESLENQARALWWECQRQQQQRKTEKQQ